MDNNYQEVKKKKQKEIEAIKKATRSYVRQKLKNMPKIKTLKNGNRIYVKNNDVNEIKIQPAGNKDAIKNRIKPVIKKNGSQKNTAAALLQEQDEKILIKNEEIKNQNGPVKNQINNEIEPVNQNPNQIIEPLNNQIIPQAVPVVDEPKEINENEQFVEIFMPPAFMMERPNEQEQVAPNEQNNIINEPVVQDNPEIQANGVGQNDNQANEENDNNEFVVEMNGQQVNLANIDVIEQNNANNEANNADNEEFVLEINGQQVNLNNVGDIGINVEDNEEENNEENNVENNQINNEEQNGNIINVQVNVDNNQEAEVVANEAVNEIAEEEELPEATMREFYSGIYYVLTGVPKNISDNELGRITLENGSAHMHLQKMAIDKLKKDEERQMEKNKKFSQVKDTVRRLEELKKDPDGKKRIRDFIKMDYTVFDSFEDIYLVMHFDRINTAIEQAEYIEKEVLPVAKENLTEKEWTNINAMLLAIHDYKNYMNLRLMIIADNNYTFAFEEEPLNGEGDAEAIDKRLEHFTERKNLSPEQLSTLMRYITYKTEKGNNPLFSMHYEMQDSAMLQRMQTYGYEAPEEDEIDDEEINHEADEMEAQLNEANPNVANQAQNPNAANRPVGLNLDQIINALEGNVGANAEAGEEAVEEANEELNEQNNIPEVPEILLPKKRKKLNYLLTGKDEVPEAEEKIKVDNRLELAERAGKNFREWQQLDPDLELDTALKALEGLTAEGFVLPDELKSLVKDKLKPGTSIEAKEENKKAVADAMYRGDENDKNLLPLVLTEIFMNSDFTKFDSVEDEDIVNNYIELKSMLNYAYSLYDLIGEAIANGTCFISQKRADNLAAIIVALNEHNKYSNCRIEVISSPYFALLDSDEALGEQDADKIKARLPKEPEEGEEAELNLFIEGLIKGRTYYNNLKGKSFMDRAKENDYTDVDNYEDETEEMQARFKAEFNRIREERNLFNSVQAVIGSRQDYDTVKANDELSEESIQNRAKLSERAKELIEGINANQPLLPLRSLLETDTGIFDTFATDSGLIENFEEAYTTASRWMSIQDMLEDEEEIAELSIAERQKLRGLKNMLCDAQRYMVEKLRQISNPCYKNMHTRDEIANEELDKDAYTRLSDNFRNDNNDLMTYVTLTGMLTQSPFLSKYAGNGAATLNAYVDEETAIDDKALLEGEEQKGSTRLAQNSVAYLLGGEEGLRNLDRKEFEKGSSVRKEISQNAKLNFNHAMQNDYKKNLAITKAYNCLDIFEYTKYQIDSKMLNVIYPQIRTGDTEDDIKFNMSLLMNLGAENKDTRGAFYKSMVDGFMAVDLTKFDRTDDDYLANNFEELNAIGLQAITFSNEDLINTFSKNGYKISAQKKNNLLVLAKCIRQYVNFMRARMVIIKHPYYYNVFRDEDGNKEYDVDVLSSRLEKASEQYEIPLKKWTKDLNELQISIPRKTKENKEYLQQLIRALTSDYSLEERSKNMKERLLDNGFEDIAFGNYDEDNKENEAYQQELEEDNFVFETFAARKDMLVTNILKDITMGDGSMSLEDFAKQQEGSGARNEIINKVRKLPDFDSIEPRILLMDLFTDDNDLIKEFLDLDLSEFDNLTDEKLIEKYTDIAALCGLETVVAPALTRLKEAEKVEDRPLTTTVAAVEGRLNMLRDAREYVLAKLSVMRDKNYEKHYNASFMDYEADREGMERKITEKGKIIGEDGRAYLRKIAIAKSTPFMAKYTGSGKDTAAAYATQQENDFYKKAEFRGEGEKIEHRGDENNPENMVAPYDAPKSIDGELESKSMEGPLKELLTMFGVSTYKKRIYEEELDEDAGFFKRTAVKLNLSTGKKKYQRTEDTALPDDVMKDLEPVKEQIKIIFDFLKGEFHYQDDALFDNELSLLLNHFEVLDAICAQYLTGRGNKSFGDMEQDVRRKVRRVRNIAEYALNQTFTSARMSRIYFRQQDFSGRRIPWKNVYYYAEQPIVWEQGIVPYNQINDKLDRDKLEVAKGNKPPRTRLKTFTDKDNAFDKVQHWMKIFSECKPDESVALDRELSIKDMERIEKLVNTTNMRASQSLPDDSEDFIRACNDMIHAFGVSNGRVMKYINSMKLETDDDRTQKEMLSNVAACFQGHIVLYDSIKDKIPDIYESIKNDPEINNISDVFRSWLKIKDEIEKNEARKLLKGQAALMYAGVGSEGNNNNK